ncbi:MAG TPA: hypothetical protein VG650_00170 [Mycobacteriales bacterium]|nr:hypothetical protein [Mycobacteriales bacterium]
MSDWNTVEYGARTLIHFNQHYDTGALSLYAHYPFIQIGPPALLIVAAMQWMSPFTVGNLVPAGMCAAAVACLWAIERGAVAWQGEERRSRMRLLVFLAGLVALPLWAYYAATWRHLEDTIATVGIIWAAALISRGRYWFLAAVLVGLAVASKPWSLAAASVLIALPRERRAPAALVAIATTGAFWAPFVLGAHGTLQALSSLRLQIADGSDLRLITHAIEAPTWVRPVQLVGGFLLCAVVARTRTWTAVPLLAFGLRVVTDPEVWPYYGLPVLLAAVWFDATRNGRWLPWMTAATAIVEFAMPHAGALPVELARLGWFLAIVVAVVVEARGVRPVVWSPWRRRMTSRTG